MSVPIIGEPTITAWFPTLSVVCGCGDRTPMLIVGLGTTVQCKSCKRTFGCGKIEFDATAGVQKVYLGHVVPKPTA